MQGHILFTHTHNQFHDRSVIIRAVQISDGVQALGAFLRDGGRHVLAGGELCPRVADGADAVREVDQVLGPVHQTVGQQAVAHHTSAGHGRQGFVLAAVLEDFGDLPAMPAAAHSV